MRTLTIDQQAALEANGIIVRSMILFDFLEGLTGFWTGIGPLSWNSINFVGAASLIDVDRPEENVSLESNEVEAKLRSYPELGITPDVLATIEDYAYRNRPVTIYTALISTTTNQLIDDPYIEWQGIVDYFSHDEGGDGDYLLTGHFVSRAADYTRRGPTVRSSQHQNMISTGDLFNDYTGVAGTAKIFFGTKVPKQLGSLRSQAAKI